MEFIVGADRFDCCIITRHPGVHNRRTESCHFVFSVMAGGCCILSGKFSFYFSFKSTFIALLRDCSFAAVCLGCLDCEFRKRASELSRPICLHEFVKVLCYF